MWQEQLSFFFVGCSGFTYHHRFGDIGGDPHCSMCRRPGGYESKGAHGWTASPYRYQACFWPQRVTKKKNSAIDCVLSLTESLKREKKVPGINFGISPTHPTASSEDFAREHGTAPYLAYSSVSFGRAESFDSPQSVLVSLAGCLQHGHIFSRKGRKAHRVAAARSICNPGEDKRIKHGVSPSSKLMGHVSCINPDPAFSIQGLGPTG